MRTCLVFVFVFLISAVIVPVGVLADPICGTCTVSSCQVQGQYYVGDEVTIYVNLATNNYYYLLIYKPDGSAVTENVGNGPGSLTITGQAGEPAGVRRVELWSNGQSSKPAATCGSFLVLETSSPCPNGGTQMITTTVLQTQISIVSQTQISTVSETQTSTVIQTQPQDSTSIVLAIIAAAVIIALALISSRRRSR